MRVSHTHERDCTDPLAVSFGRAETLSLFRVHHKSLHLSSLWGKVVVASDKPIILIARGTVNWSKVLRRD